MTPSLADRCIDLLRRMGVIAVDEDGAVTVDWVVISAAIVIISVVAIGVVRPGIYRAASDIRNMVSTR